MYKNAREADPHRDALYAWEVTWPGWNTNAVSLKACREAIHSACDFYDIERPVVVQHPQRTLSWYLDDRIDLQGGDIVHGGRNIPTALHEAAHHIAFHKYGFRIQDHGRKFLAIYLHLLTRAKVAPRIALEATARAHGLKWK